jgi:hypothetical protein
MLPCGVFFMNCFSNPIWWIIQPEGGNYSTALLKRDTLVVLTLYSMSQNKTKEAASLSSSKLQDLRLKLPGFGRPLDYAPTEKNIYGVHSRSLFPSALDDRDIEAGYVE